MDDVLGSFGLAGILLYIALFFLWLLVPVFIFLISRRVREMRDVVRDSQLEIMELNANIKYIKQKYSNEE
ncbi:hypothetical protein [Paraglaciecola chathamensis]|jgi:hypothetical protein|uniref:DUF4083 domain-containing protein n=2 Tax=Paraglaciecola chathamensis TaxID=368405 RepID=A0ABQ0I9E6_9ALTE|nr:MULTISPECIES: hypothetical protein [Paraglaciecola]GAC05989.1 hypothetical protein GAGA_3155 [Paraglaciecola agarilytica NO2]GAC10914.1 hypothetical protein GCHA_2972 [Paraglaciecola chathamensis S18K6]